MDDAAVTTSLDTCLTDDDLRICLSHASLQSLGRSSAVSKRWRSLSSEHGAWRDLLERCYPGLAAAVVEMHERALMQSMVRANSPPERYPPYTSMP